MAIKNPVPKTFAHLARLETGMRHYKEAIKYAEKAVVLAPNDADVLYSAGRALTWAGKPQEALKHLEKSNILDPLNRARAFMICPYFSLKQYEKAVASFEKSITNIRESIDLIPFAAASYAYLGQKKEAKGALDKWIAMTGRMGVASLYQYYSSKDNEVFDRFMKGLEKAGRDGNITDYTKVNRNNKLTGQEIKDLMFGKTEIIKGWDRPEFFRRKENGEILHQAGYKIKKGISWIKNDMLCNKFEEFAKGCDDCADIYRNPLGDYAFTNEYLKVTDYGIIPFSIKQEEN